MSKTIEAFNAWWQPGFGALGDKNESLAFQAFLQGVAWKEAQDLAAVEAEPELPGPIPDAVWEQLSRQGLTEVLYAAVRLTKVGIAARIKAGGES